MTTIIGFVDKKTNIGYMGGDGLASTQDEKFHLSLEASKVIKKGSWLIGGAGVVRLIQILQYKDILLPSNTTSTRAVFITQVIPTIQNLFNEFQVTDERGGFSGSLLFTNGRVLYKVQQDFSLLTYRENYNTCGTGGLEARASLYTTNGLKIHPIERIIKAFMATENQAIGTGRPFVIRNTKDNKVIEVT